MKTTSATPEGYFADQTGEAHVLAGHLKTLVDAALPRAVCRLYHGSPVWFLDDNPLVGVTVMSSGAVQLLFWGGQSFGEPGLKPVGKHQAAETKYTQAGQIDAAVVERWLHKAVEIQWDYPGLRANEGVLKRRN